MANQQNPNRSNPAHRSGQQPRKDEQGGQGGTPGTRPDPYRHPGDEPDIKPDVIAGQGQPSKGGDKPRYGNTGGNRSGGQEGSK